MSAKPTLGYATRTDAVLALRAQGLTNTAIAGKLGIEPKTVSALASSRVRTEVCRRRPDAVRTNDGSIHISMTCRQKLRPHAASRQLSVDALIRVLIEKISEDKLVDAVLDDEGVLYI